MVGGKEENLHDVKEATSLETKVYEPVLKDICPTTYPGTSGKSFNSK